MAAEKYLKPSLAKLRWLNIGNKRTVSCAVTMTYVFLRE